MHHTAWHPQTEIGRKWLIFWTYKERVLIVNLNYSLDIIHVWHASSSKSSLDTSFTLLQLSVQWFGVCWLALSGTCAFITCLHADSCLPLHESYMLVILIIALIVLECSHHHTTLPWFIHYHSSSIDPPLVYVCHYSLRLAIINGVC